MMDSTLVKFEAEFISGTATGSAFDAVSSFEHRELMRIINSHTASRERFMQKLRSPAYQWKKPAPRRK